MTGAAMTSPKISPSRSGWQRLRSAEWLARAARSGHVDDHQDDPDADADPGSIDLGEAEVVRLQRGGRMVAK
jgi:hypothetical protein